MSTRSFNSRTAAAMVAVLVLGSLGACSSDDDGDDAGSADGLPVTDTTGDPSQISMPSGEVPEPAVPGGDITPIAGLYDARRTIGADVDERFALFDPTGLYTVYDYEQDALGSGSNCYRLSEPVAVTPDGGDAYTVGERPTTIVRTDTGIDLSFVDSTDEDEDGDTTETLMQSWPEEIGMSAQDLTDCRALE